MVALREIYRCTVCGNVTEVVNENVGELVCCDQPMVKLAAKTEDAGLEKHVPVIEDSDACPTYSSSAACVKVKVGSVEHPMEEDHYIKFIEVLTGDKVLRAELKPGQKPEAHFCVKKDDIVEVREFCTTHMLWKA